MEQIGQILAALRKEKGLAQKELAPLLNLSVSTISNYENGVHAPDLQTLRCLADFYGVTTDFLLSRTNYRGDPDILSRPIGREYTVADIVDTVIACENCGQLDNLMRYANFLCSGKPGGDDIPCP